jgi:hypothetical protein
MVVRESIRHNDLRCLNNAGYAPTELYYDKNRSYAVEVAKLLGCSDVEELFTRPKSKITRPTITNPIVYSSK